MADLEGLARIAENGDFLGHGAPGQDGAEDLNHDGEPAALYVPNGVAKPALGRLGIGRGLEVGVEKAPGSRNRGLVGIGGVADLPRPR